MPMNGLSVGRDITLELNFSGGPLVFAPHAIQNFDRKPLAPIKNYMGMDGIIIPVLFHNGWELSIDVGRFDNGLDLWWAEAEALYYQGISLPGGTIIETIQEATGAVSQFIYTNLVLKLDDAGNWKGDEFVTQKLSGVASRKQVQ